MPILRPAVMLTESPTADQSTADLPIQRYFAKDWHDREVQQVWRKCWQLACRVSAKAKRLRAEGRASMLVVEVANGMYRSVLVPPEGRGRPMISCASSQRTTFPTGMAKLKSS